MKSGICTKTASSLSRNIVKIVIVVINSILDIFLLKNNFIKYPNDPKNTANNIDVIIVDMLFAVQKYFAPNLPFSSAKSLYFLPNLIFVIIISIYLFKIDSVFPAVFFIGNIFIISIYYFTFNSTLKANLDYESIYQTSPEIILIME